MLEMMTMMVARREDTPLVERREERRDLPAPAHLMMKIAKKSVSAMHLSMEVVMVHPTEVAVAEATATEVAVAEATATEVAAAAVATEVAVATAMEVVMVHPMAVALLEKSVLNMK